MISTWLFSNLICISISLPPSNGVNGSLSSERGLFSTEWEVGKLFLKYSLFWQVIFAKFKAGTMLYLGVGLEFNISKFKAGTFTLLEVLLFEDFTF